MNGNRKTGNGKRRIGESSYRRKPVSIFFVLFLFTFSVSRFTPAFAGNSQKGSSAANFLKITPGAAASAMGGSSLGLAQDAFALYHNPAGLAGQGNASVAASHISHFGAINFNFFGAAFPLTGSNDPGPALGLAATSLAADNIEKRSGDSDQPESLFKAGDMAYQISYAQPLGGLMDFGLSAKYINSKIETVNATAWAFDAAVFKRRPWDHVEGLGLVIRNAGAPMKFSSSQSSDPLPLTVDLGAALTWFDNRLIMAPELHFPRDNDPSASLGLQLNLRFSDSLALALRGGYNTAWRDPGGLSGVAAGLGLSYNSVAIDFAWLPTGDLGNSLRYSLAIKF